MHFRYVLLSAVATCLMSAHLMAQDQLYYDLSKFPSIQAVKPNITGAYTIWAADTLNLDTLTFTTGFMRSKIVRSGGASSFHPFVPKGRWGTAYANGMTEVVEYQNGQLTGVYELRNEKGQLTTQGHLEKGRPVGLWTTYHPDGGIATEKVWRNGRVKLATAKNPDGSATVTAGNGTLQEGGIKCQIKDSVRVGSVSYADAQSGLSTFAVDYQADGSISVRNLKGGGSGASTFPPSPGMDLEITTFVTSFTTPSMPDPAENYHLSVDAVPHNLDQVKSSIGYPAEALQYDIQGKVVVRVLVDEQGKVLFALLLRNPNPILSNAVLDKMDKLRFTPGGWDGQPAASWVTIPFDFKLMK